MPRAEITKRTASYDDTLTWIKDDRPREYSVSNEHLCRLTESARAMSGDYSCGSHDRLCLLADTARMMSEEVLAGYDGEPFC